MPHQLNSLRYLRQYVSLFGHTSILWFILGLLTLLFFQCMVALVNPVHRRGERIKLWLVFYTMAMFSFVTVYTAMNLNNLSMSFIDNRVPIEPDFSGPVEYYIYIPYTPLGLLPNVMFNLNNWLADGLLVGPLFDAVLTLPGV